MSGMWRKAPETREVVLHIGMGKTGTSVIQRFLADHRDALLAGGVLYPRATGPVRHAHLGHSAKSDEHLLRSLVWQRGGHSDPAAYREHHRTRLAEEIAATRPERLLFSDEGLYSFGPYAIGNVRSLLAPYAAARTVVVYLRPPAEHLVSRYQQSVKVGATDRLVDFAQGDHRATYDYAHRLAQWEQTLAPVRLLVRPFQVSRFAGGSLLQDFVTTVDLPVPPASDGAGRRNESLDAESVEVLRLLNVAAVELDGARPGAIDNRAAVDVLATLPRGPLLTLPEPMLEAFGARWADSLAEVARRHLGGAPLFTPSRTTAATTTRQALAPERLAELLELLEVPAERRRHVSDIARRS